MNFGGNMKFCKNKIVLIIVLVMPVTFFSNCEKKSETFDGKITCTGDECKKQLILALEDLRKIEMPDGLTETQIELKHNEIRKVVDRFDNPRDISGLAMLSRAMGRHCSIPDIICEKESKLISTYDNAFWFCVDKLAKNVEQNREVLDNLKFLSVLNGTEKGNWGSIVDGKEFP